MSDLKSCVEPILTLSTGHLHKSLVKGIGNTKSFMDEHAAMTGEHGWLLWTGGDNEPMFMQKAFETPTGLESAAGLAELRKILSEARTQGCSFVMFDGDGEISALFLTYDW